MRAARAALFSTEAEQKTHFGFKDVLKEDKAGLVGGVFSSVASSYDVMNDLMSAGLHRVWKDQLVASLSLPSTLRYHLGEAKESGEVPESPYFRHLDVAGGTGDVSFRVMDVINDALDQTAGSPTRLPPPASVTIIDINPDMLTVGEERALSRYGSSNVAIRSEAEFGSEPEKPLNFYEGDAQYLPFPSDTFDTYTITFGLRNVTDPTLAIREAYRVLRKGGRLKIMEFSHPKNGFVGELYDRYSFSVIPAMGEAVAGDRESYQYLVESIRKWDKQEALVERIEKEGFVGVKYEEINLGVVAVHEGWKI
ncbi:hypothetical protein TrRE_jg2565 [Triparma retinervis]|uniref:2-methoxy-6-polyprenyl-1,4-benzoquinol methylase, mitochondrial n=1 Tax=Triparma retinervis TaxID=2557542 RepID=A0A9W6ZYF5_9STRA|nr:hypothetical protein TrRE_jg2565 [Triparma retinervis]